LELLAVNPSDGLDGFEFKNDEVVDDDIRTEALVEVNAIIGDRNGMLADA
jgi:hypothetical protein